MTAVGTASCRGFHDENRGRHESATQNREHRDIRASRVARDELGARRNATFGQHRLLIFCLKPDVREGTDRHGNRDLSTDGREAINGSKADGDRHQNATEDAHQPGQRSRGVPRSRGS